MMDDIISSLNPKQKEAVTYCDGHELVLAGAGSGKTRVLTTKIAYLIGHENVRPWRILALTFTNKAAKEMKSRVESLLGDDLRGMLPGKAKRLPVPSILRTRLVVKAAPTAQNGPSVTPAITLIACWNGKHFVGPTGIDTTERTTPAAANMQ